jgi:hypothetical protein
VRDESTEARLRLAVRGNKPNATQLAKGADPRGEYDLSALARFAIQGDAIIGPDVRALLDAKDDEIWRLRVQVAHLQGDRVGTQGKRTFQPTSRKQSAAANRQSRRTLAHLEAHLYAIWEAVEAPDAEWWSVEGFENLVFTLIQRGLPGSGARFEQRWVTKRLFDLFYGDAHCREYLEKARAMVKLWVPNDFNVQQRRGHAGAAAWRAGRRFMGRQMFGSETLLSWKKDSKQLARLWTPIGSGFDEPENADEAGGRAAVTRARARAQRSMGRAEEEAKLLRSRAEKDLAKQEAEEAERMQTEGVSPLTPFAAAGITLLLKNEPTKDTRGKKIAVTKRREDATRKWLQGGEGGEGETRVFEGAEVHHLLLVDSNCARSSSEALLAFQKVLVTGHEMFIDELHVSAAARGGKLSYHLLDGMRLLQQPPDRMVRLQVEEENEIAVHGIQDGIVCRLDATRWWRVGRGGGRAGGWGSHDAHHHASARGRGRAQVSREAARTWRETAALPRRRAGRQSCRGRAADRRTSANPALREREARRDERDAELARSPRP